MQLVLPVFAHRRDKNLSYLADCEKEGFEIVASVCDQWSEEKMDKFFSRPILAFMFAWLI